MPDPHGARMSVYTLCVLSARQFVRPHSDVISEAQPVHESRRFRLHRPRVGGPVDPGPEAGAAVWILDLNARCGRTRPDSAPEMHGAGHPRLSPEEEVPAQTYGSEVP